MTFDTYFRLSSYAMIASGTLALAVSGGMGAGLCIVFALILAAGWKFEGTRWQLSERAGMLAVISSLPLLYLDWKLQSLTVWEGETARAGIAALTHFILFLSAIKLIQVKADRDWLFLYLISFFEVLLAAGLSVSPFFITSLALYTFCALSTVVCFEIRKARRAIAIQETRLLSAPRARWLSRLSKKRLTNAPDGDARRVPLVALFLLTLIFALALPIFFIMPRFSGSALARAEGGLNGVIGFSDEVTLGEIGRLQQSESVVMRVRVEDPLAARHQTLRWRGVALDEFSGRTWRRKSKELKYLRANERNLFAFGTTQALENLTTQTFFVEPIDTPVLFIASRPVAIQAALPYIGIDREDGLVTRNHSQERISYRAFSDTTEPPAEQLRRDLAPYTREMEERYLKVPDDLDPRIRQLTRGLIVGTSSGNRYDAARVIEAYFHQNFRYTLEQKSGGAEDPVADFLFRVREGHCEYFSTAMAVMLRTAGVATRVVNGFQLGEYNDAADVYTVRQSDAHSWVEVYFPETGAWVTFDPTPVDGRPGGSGATGFWRGRLGKYTEALELFWIQYVVAYDKQEQRSLATSLRGQLGVYRQTAGQTFAELRAGLSDWWRQLTIGADSSARGIAGFVNVPLLIALGLPLGLLLLLVARMRQINLLELLKKFWGREKKNYSSVVFYERMTKALETRGLLRSPEQTPLEFAAMTGMPEATLLTRSYNRVRFGAHELTTAEAARIEEWLRRVEGIRP